MSATFTNVTDADFQQEVLNSDLPVVVDFWAPWCGPCRMVTPVLEVLGTELTGKVRFVKVNVDENQGQAAALGVQGIPALLFFQGGQLVHRVVGAVPEDHLRNEVKQAFKLD